VSFGVRGGALRKTAIGFLVCSLLTPVPPVCAAVHLVDCAGGGGFLTIQEAVDAAAHGDTILVAECLYEEQVTVQGKAVTIQGAGSDVTELLWDADSHALRLSMTEWPVVSRVLDITVSNPNSGDNAAAVLWAGHAVFTRCVLEGKAHGSGYLVPEPPWAGADITDCSLSALRILGGGSTDLTRCEVGRAEWTGHFDYENTGVQYVETVECVIGEVHDHGVSTFRSTGDDIGAVTLHGGMHATPFMRAAGSKLGVVTCISECDLIGLESCELSSFTYEDPDGWHEAMVTLTGCLVHGDVSVDAARIHHVWKHNTILGGFGVDNPVGAYWQAVRGNIVMGEASIVAGWPFAVTHNDFAGGAYIDVPGDSVFANISEDPLFCVPASHDYTLQDCSPCVGAAHDGGDIGAFGEGCECAVAVEDVSWGRIKSLYR
jgi:hypothetical protein